MWTTRRRSSPSPCCRTTAAAGWARRLLRELLDAAAGRFGAVSLSVRAENPALRLYKRTGFRVAMESETREFTAGGSVTMKIELRGLTTGSGAG